VFPWPSQSSSDGEDAVAAFKELKSVADEIKASRADLIYIVAHSSGCAIANAVDDALKDHSKIGSWRSTAMLPAKNNAGPIDLRSLVG
jgi:hypothetical protein